MNANDLPPAMVAPTNSAAAMAWREREILAFMRGLTDERDRLRRNHPGRLMSKGDLQRMTELESALDQSWELVRQRRARRASGQGWDDLTDRVAKLVATLT